MAVSCTGLKVTWAGRHNRGAVYMIAHADNIVLSHIRVCCQISITNAAEYALWPAVYALKDR